MKIYLDLSTLDKQQVSANQYIFLYLIFLNKSKAWEYSVPEDLVHLQDKLFIKITGSQEVILRKKAIDLFEVDNTEAKWLEFKANYPIKMGERRLHLNQEVCKEKYLALIKKLGVHEQVLLGLDNEKLARINAQKKREFFPDWSAMEVWLNQKRYQAYLDYQEEQIEEKTKGI